VLYLTTYGRPMDMPWFVWPAILIIAAVSVVASLLKALGAASGGLAALKGLSSIGQTLSGRSAGAAQPLAGPVDLVGQSLAVGIMTNPAIIQLRTIMAGVQLCRQPGSNQVPTQFLTQRLAASWGTGLPALPTGMFQMLELHARPQTPTPVGERMLVWVKGRINAGAPFTEYWTFVTTAPLASLPAKCPSCGAPTAASTTTGICAYCQTVLVTFPAANSGTPATWVVDEISVTPPAAAAA
jgi:hypothetical protein